ncbi:sensory neuron membrane protein 2 [Halyomorpha halys]|uniref:sensory neuron membrane protein 2 n=1 Tax=Halyomorpha halys TaxID=286706 RepID=UPI0006D523B7
MKGLMELRGLSRVVYTGSAGCFIIVLSIYFGIAGFPYLLQQQIKSKIVLNNGSEGMEAWESLPLPLEFKVFIFNVTNPDEVSKGMQPVVQELGPYVYDQYRRKVNIEFTEDDTISYRIEKKFYFNKNKSGCYRESDVVVVPNVPLIGTAYRVEERFPMGLIFINSSASLLFPGIKNLFLTTTVGDLFFNGVRIKCDYLKGPAMPVCQGIKRNLPPSLKEIPLSRDFAFSYFSDANSSVSGVFKTYRGNKNVYDLGRIIKYDNNTHLTMWDKNTTCSELKGTDSTILAPIQNKDQDIYIFLPEVCLSLKAVFSRETNMYGIDVYQYMASHHNFDSEKRNPSHICRCKKQEDEPNAPPMCLKDGAIDASKCQGAPVVFTYPHMLFADPEYQNYVKGYKGDYEKHQTEVFIEPRTGVPLAAFKRIQMNIFLRRLEDVDLFANISEGLFPLIWIEEALTEELVQTYLSDMKELMSTTRIIMSVTGLLIGVGIFCLLVALILYIKHRNVACMKENQVVSNISLIGHGIVTRKDPDTAEKRIAYDLPNSLSSDRLTVQKF